MQKKISMIIPCYNEAGNIKLFFQAAIKAYQNSNYNLEFIFIDDGSTDDTLTELKTIAKTKNYHLTIISFSRHFGKEAALSAGLHVANGDYTVFIDADGQQPPGLTVKMAAILDANTDVDCVCCCRTNRLPYHAINLLLDTQLHPGAGDFRMFRSNIRDALLSIGECHRFTKGIFSWIGFNTEYLPYNPLKRTHGRSKYGFLKLSCYSIEGVISFSAKPLKLITLTGYIASILSFLYLLSIYFSPPYPADASGRPLLGLFLLLSSTNLLALGILGAYVSRIYDETRHRPLYIIKTTISNQTKQEPSQKKHK